MTLMCGSLVGAVRIGPVDAGANGGEDEVAVAAGEVVGHQDLAEEVVTADGFAALPEDEEDARGADGLAGMQLAVNKLLAGLDGKRALG